MQQSFAKIFERIITYVRDNKNVKKKLKYVRALYRVNTVDNFILIELRIDVFIISHYFI